MFAKVSKHLLLRRNTQSFRSTGNSYNFHSTNVTKSNRYPTTKQTSTLPQSAHNPQQPIYITNSHPQQLSSNPATIPPSSPKLTQFLHNLPKYLNTIPQIYHNYIHRSIQPTIPTPRTTLLQSLPQHPSKQPLFVLPSWSLFGWGSDNNANPTPNNSDNQEDVEYIYHPSTFPSPLRDIPPPSGASDLPSKPWGELIEEEQQQATKDRKSPQPRGQFQSPQQQQMMGQGQEEWDLTDDEEMEIQFDYKGKPIPPWVPRRGVPRFEPRRKEGEEPMPPPPPRNREDRDEYGISKQNIYRFCSDQRLREKFKVEYSNNDIHHNINQYRTFIEKERFCIQKDYLQLSTIQNIFIKRLLQLHYIFGIKLERENEYKEMYRLKVYEDLIQKKRVKLKQQQFDHPELNITDEMIEAIDLTVEELDAVDLDLFGEVRMSKLLPEDLRQASQKDKDQNSLLEQVSGVKPIDPNDIDTIPVEFVEKQLHIPELITSSKPKFFFQPEPGDLTLLPPNVLEFVEQTRGCVIFSMRSMEELARALHTLNETLSAFDTMVNDSMAIEEYKQEMNLLSCQAAFITGTRQVIHNLLRHSNDALYKYEQFYTPQVTNWLSSLIFHPESHTNTDQLTPWNRLYFDKFTPPEEIEAIELELTIREKQRQQDYINQHTNRLKNKQDKLVKSKPVVPEGLGFSDAPEPPKFPEPPLVAVEEAKVHSAVQSFAKDMQLDKAYEPISHPYRAVIHKWKKEDKDDVVEQFHQHFVIPSHTIPPPENYRPYPREFPAMSGVESDVPVEFQNDPRFGWQMPKDEKDRLEAEIAMQHQDLLKEQIVYSEYDPEMEEEERYRPQFGHDQQQFPQPDQVPQYQQFPLDSPALQGNATNVVVPKRSSHWK